MSDVGFETHPSLESFGAEVALEPRLLVMDLPDVALERLLGAEHGVASRALAGCRLQVDDVDVSLETIAVSKLATTCLALPRRRRRIALEALVELPDVIDQWAAAAERLVTDQAEHGKGTRFVVTGLSLLFV